MHSHTIYRGFPTRIVYLYYTSCLRYTILAGNHRYGAQERNKNNNKTPTKLHDQHCLSNLEDLCKNKQKQENQHQQQQKHLPVPTSMTCIVCQTEKIVATESGSHALLKEGLTELLRPVVRTMLVGEWVFFLFCFFCVPQLYLWGSPLFGWDFCVCDRF